VSAHNPIINYFFAAKSFYPRQRGKKRRYYEQEYIQDSFLHSEESSKQRRQVGNHAPFDRWKIQCKMLPKTKEHLTLEFPTKSDTVTAILGCFPNQ
jgi:hypothetical protein